MTAHEGVATELRHSCSRGSKTAREGSLAWKEGLFCLEISISSGQMLSKRVKTQ